MADMTPAAEGRLATVDAIQLVLRRAKSVDDKLVFRVYCKSVGFCRGADNRTPRRVADRCTEALRPLVLSMLSLSGAVGPVLEADITLALHHPDAPDTVPVSLLMTAFTHHLFYAGATDDSIADDFMVLFYAHLAGLLEEGVA